MEDLQRSTKDFRKKFFEDFLTSVKFTPKKRENAKTISIKRKIFSRFTTSQRENFEFIKRENIIFPSMSRKRFLVVTQSL